MQQVLLIAANRHIGQAIQSLERAAKMPGISKENLASLQSVIDQLSPASTEMGSILGRLGSDPAGVKTGVVTLKRVEDYFFGELLD